MRCENVHERIMELCEERNISSYRLMKICDISESTFYNMMNRKSMPRIDLIQRICDGLEIQLEDFFGGKSKYVGLTKEEKNMLYILSELDAELRNRILTYAEGIRDGRVNG